MNRKNMTKTETQSYGLKKKMTYGYIGPDQS